MKNSINNDSYSQIPNETLNNKPQISPTKNFKTKPSPFLTTPKPIKIKFFPLSMTPRAILPNRDFNINSIFNNFAKVSKIFPKQKILISKKNQKKILILDIDETLVHSAFAPFNRPADILLNIKFNGLNKKIYVLKRPHVDEFLKELSNIFEIITFTASLSQYADPLLDSLDKFHVVSHRLFRENCINQKGMYIKDLRKIGTDLKNIILIDNNPISYIMNIDNGLPILTWYESLKDNELMKLIPLLKYLANVEDVRTIIKKVVNRKSNTIDFNIVNQIIKGNNDNILNNNYNESANKNKAINYSMIAKK